MKQYCIKRELYGHEIEAVITKMPQDIHILLAGGELPHIGAVSIFRNGQKEAHTELAKHKEGGISSKWARELSVQFLCRVTVACGIHYDNLTPEMIGEIVRQTDEMLSEVRQDKAVF